MRWLVPAVVAGLFASAALYGVDPDGVAGIDAPTDHAAWFGLDALGRDRLARLLHGAATSAWYAGLAAGLGLAVATAMAALGAVGPRPVRGFAAMLTDATIAAPALLVAITLAALWGRDPLTLAVAVGLLDWPDAARALRSRLEGLARETHVTAARALGGSAAWVLRRHLLPGVADLAGRLAAMLAARAMVIEGSLAFVGLGVEPPHVTLGMAVAEGTRAMRGDPGALLAPLAVMLGLLLLLAAATRRPRRPR